MNRKERTQVIKRLKQCDYEDRKLEEACLQELSRAGLLGPGCGARDRAEWCREVRKILKRYGVSL